MGNSFGKIDGIIYSSTEQLSVAIYVDFTGRSYRFEAGSQPVGLGTV